MPRSSDGIEFQLVRRRGQRSIRITIAHGGVRVSAGLSQPLAAITAFVDSKAGWIAKHLCDTRGKAEFPWRQGADVYLLGQRYTLALTVQPRPQVRVGQGTVWIGGADLPACRRAWQRYCRQLLQQQVASYQAMLPADVGPYVLGYRDMTSRWGSCVVGRRKITISLRCASLPPEAIRYVVVHEAAHLAVASHQPAFYRRVAQLWPGYRQGLVLAKTFTMD